MGIIQKDALRTTIVSYIGLILGYLNKGVLFIWFLTTEQIGLINLLVGVGVLFGSLSGFGSSYALWKFFPFLKDREKNHHGLIVYTLLISILGGLFFAFLSWLFQNEVVEAYKTKSAPFIDYYYWIIPLGFANLLFVILETYLRAIYHNVISVFVYEFVLRGCISLLLLAYGFDLLSFDQFLIVHCLAYFIPVLWLMLFLKRKQELNLSPRTISIPKKFRKIIVSFGMFSYLNSVGTLVVTTMDTMMVASMVGLRATGVYTTVIYLTSALQIPYKSMIRISSPMVSEMWKQGKKREMGELYKKFSSVNIIVAFFMFLFIWVNREGLFSFLPSDFHDGIWVFLFLMIGRLTDIYMGLNGVILSMSKKFKYDIYFTIVLIVIVAILNLVLIPIYGMIGSAIATCAAYIVYNVGRVYFVFKHYRIHPFEYSQLTVILLFVAVLIAFELLPLFPEVNTVMEILLRWILLALIFPLPIYVFRLNTDIVDYTNAVLKKMNIISSKNSQ